MPKTRNHKMKRRKGGKTVKSRVGGRAVHPRAKRLDGNRGYSIGGKVYQRIEGSRAQVMNGTAHRTTGGLTKSDLTYNRNGEIVSVERQRIAKKLNNLGDYKQPKGSGEFGPNQ